MFNLCSTIGPDCGRLGRENKETAVVSLYELFNVKQRSRLFFEYTWNKQISLKKGGYNGNL
ncbi:hypothetical protein [Lederbergia citrea]|uniref:hypothetical protein n=1 Tax=Lederbergia citrea TaxID=2833581 RepID=UPI001BC8FB8B|nr:hypothetical protein [Lederbergia citrea]MBS4203541.1 hypothetical protein [Lederbergia citrea]